MAWTGNTICLTFLRDLLKAKHDFDSHTFKLALYDEDATLNFSTTDYTATNEVSGTGYTAGGNTVTAIAPATGGKVAYVDFQDVTFSGVTVSARGALLYNTTTDGGAGTTDAIMVIDFGQLITKTAADLVVTMPSGDEFNSLLRIRLE